VADTSTIEESSLIQTLLLFIQQYHKSISIDALLDGLPISPATSLKDIVSGKGGPSLFSRAAEKAGLKTSLVKRPLQKVLQLQLPAIALLDNDNACILEQFSEDRSQIKIIHPGAEPLEEWVALKDLEEEYLGYCFLLKKTHHYNVDQQHLGQQKHWFWGTLKRSRKLYIDVLLASFLINIFILASPIFTMSVYDRVVPNNAIETLKVFAVGVITVYLLDSFLKFIRSYFLEIAAKKSDVIMSSIIFEKIMDMKIAVFPRSVGSFASNIKDFDSIRGFLTNATLTTLIDLPFAIIFFIVIGWIGGSIVFIPMVSGCLILLFAIIIRNPLRRSIESTYEASAWKNGVLIESLQNIETIKSHGLSHQAQHQWEEATGDIAAKSLRSRLLSASLPTITGLLVQLNTVLVVFYGVYLIRDLELTTGGLIAIVILTSRTIAPLGQAAALITNFEDAKTAFKVIDDITMLPDEHPRGVEFVRPPEFKGKIEFRDVTFCYPDNEKPAVENLSFVVEPGEKVGIIGRMGSGKSTIEKLILGLYEPQSGMVLIDNIDIRQIDPADLRQHINYVPQDIQLFRGTVRENIIKGSRKADDAALLNAARLSGVEEFITQHPSGFDMWVGERGMGLSGGQRQSVAIARALMRKGVIHLYDEPSNAMDQLTEARLLKQLATVVKPATFILVTQKTAPLQLVDRIIVMEQGKKAMDGTTGEILTKLGGSRDKDA
jgi:ATP-binding cassette subfamily C protein LapB